MKKKYKLKKVVVFADLLSLAVVVFAIIAISKSSVFIGDRLVVISIWAFIGVYLINNWKWYDESRD